jgi:hypothetical protein
VLGTQDEVFLVFEYVDLNLPRYLDYAFFPIYKLDKVSGVLLTIVCSAGAPSVFYSPKVFKAATPLFRSPISLAAVDLNRGKNWLICIPFDLSFSFPFQLMVDSFYFYLLICSMLQDFGFIC